MDQRGKKYDDLPKTDLREFYTLEKVKEWREKEDAEGRPSSLEAFYLAHGLCWACHATGIALAPVDWEGDVALYAKCEICGGTGKIGNS